MSHICCTCASERMAENIKLRQVITEQQGIIKNLMETVDELLIRDKNHKKPILELVK